MECATRAMSFWSYQATQEVVYQEYLAKSWTDKHTHLNTQMDNLVHEANTQIQSLQEKMSRMQLEHDELERKNHELTEAYRENSHRHNQVQQLYDKLKQRSLLSQAQQAASESVDQIAHAKSHPAPRPPGSVETLMNSPRHGASAGYSPALHRTSEQMRDSRAGAIGSSRRVLPSISRNGTVPGGLGKPGVLPATPIQHRQLLSNMGPPRSGHQGNSYQGTDNRQMQSPTRRQPLHTLNSNVGTSPKFAGYGLTAGMKLGRQ